MTTELCYHCNEGIIGCPYTVHGRCQKCHGYIHSSGVRAGKHYHSNPDALLDFLGLGEYNVAFVKNDPDDAIEVWDVQE